MARMNDSAYKMLRIGSIAVVVVMSVVLMAGSSINLPAPAVAVCAGIDVIGLIALVATTWMRWGGR